MIFNLFDRVKIKTNGVTGDIVDIDDSGMITIEGDKGGTMEGAVYGDDWPLYYCRASDLELIQENISVPDYE